MSLEYLPIMAHAAAPKPPRVSRHRNRRGFLSTGTIVIDHHSGIGRVPKQDPEIISPRTALASLAQQGVIGGISPTHFSFMGGVRHTQKVEDELAPAIAAELKKAAVDLALLVPY